MICTRALALPLVAALMVSAPALAEDATSQIVMTGSASVSVDPDQALLNAGVETIGSSAREALDRNNAAMAGVISALRAIGVEERDIQTSDFHIGANYEASSGGSRQRGFRVGNRVRVHLRDADKLGSALDALVSAGANDVGNVQFVVDNPDDLLDEARREAVAKAKARAELYAGAAGVTLGQILDIREGSGGGAPMPVFARRGMAEAMSVPVSSGQSELSVSVTITWALN